MRTRRLLVVASVLLLGSCGLAPTRSDDALCVQIVGFANSVAEGATETVRLETAWGTDLSGDAEALFEKQCEHNGYLPGLALCEHLIENASTEFMGINISRTLNCLNGTLSKNSRGNYIVESLHGKVRASAAVGLDDSVLIEVEFSTEQLEAFPYLRIAASRESK